MDSKFFIPGDSLAWTFAKPAMLAVAVVGGMSGQAGPESRPLSPKRPALSRPPAAPTLAAPGFSDFALAKAAVITTPAAAMAAPRVRPSHLYSPARPLAAPLAQPAPPPAPASEHAPPPEAQGLASEPLPAPAPPLALSSSGEMFAGIQQVVAAPGDAATGAGLVDLRLPGSAMPAEPAATLPTVEFVSVPVVQAVPESAAAKPELTLGPPQAAPDAPALAAPVRAKPAAAAAAPKAMVGPVRAPAPAPQAAFAQTAKPKAITAPASKAKQAYTVNNGTIDFALSTRINGQPAGALPLRVTPDDRLWLRLRDLLLLVRERMNPLEFDRIAMSSNLDDYVEFDTVRGAGIALRYDAARNQIDLGVN